MSADFDPPSPVLDQREKLFVAVWSIFLVAVCFVPIVHGFATAPPGWQFTGFHSPGLNDYQGYMAWMRQARDGHFLFLDRFTTEPHGRISFHPLFWLMGTVSAWTGVPLLALWYGVLAACLVLMVWAIHRFSAEFTESRPTRVLATVLATTASGLGWLFPGAPGTHVIRRPIDLWLEEANQFRAVGSSFFTLTLALALMLLAAVWMLRYFRDGALRDAAVAGLMALVLGMVHPYDLVTLYAVLGVWTLLAGRRRFPGMVVMVAVSVPILVYGFLAVRLDPVLSRFDLAMEMPPLSAWVIGWGLPLALALAAFLTPSVWRDHRRVRLLLVWVAVHLALLLTPVEFRRKLSWGLQAIFCLLAATSLRALVLWLTVPLASRPAWRRAAAVAMAGVAVAAMAFGSLQFLLVQLQDRGTGRYLPDGVIEALRVLDEKTSEDDVVLAGPGVAGFVPGWAGATAFWGHWALTVDLAAKRRLAVQLTTPGRLIDRAAAGAVLAEHRVRFVVLDRVSAAMGPGRTWPVDEERLPIAPFVRPVYRNDDAVLLEVSAPSSGS
jgi:hypothetical protein